MTVYPKVHERPEHDAIVIQFLLSTAPEQSVSITFPRTFDTVAEYYSALANMGRTLATFVDK